MYVIGAPFLLNVEMYATRRRHMIRNKGTEEKGVERRLQQMEGHKKE